MAVLFLLTSSVSLHISVLPDNNGALWASPVLLIQMSTPPNCDFIALIIDKMSSSLPTSHISWLPACLLLDSALEIMSVMQKIENT